jgi:hypothetical protein
LDTKSTKPKALWALWAWWIWCQITTAAVESHRVSQLAVRREASLKKSILNFSPIRLFQMQSGTWNNFDLEQK